MNLKDVIRTALGIALLAVCFVVLKDSCKTFYLSAYPIQYKQYVNQSSKNNDVPDELIYAIIRTESGFDPQAVSKVDARGLMQITRSTFDWATYRMGQEQGASYDKVFDPELNIEYGTYIMSLLLQEFGSVENALCAYHAGWGSVTEWLATPEYSSDGITLEKIPFPETRAYVDKVMTTIEIYKQLYNL